MSLKLTIKQEKFCNKHIECGNASEAYRFAYSCSKMKDSTIWENANRLLNNPKVAARIKELQDELKAKSDIKKEHVLNKLSAILDSKITDYVDFNGEEVKFYDFNLLTDKQVEAIESIKHGKYGIELKLHGKSWTIERICRMLGFDAPIRNELTGKDGKDLFAKLTDDELDSKVSDLEKKIKLLSK